MDKDIQYTVEERLLLDRIKEFHQTNGTPNHRDDEESALEIALKGAENIPSFPMRK